MTTCHEYSHMLSHMRVSHVDLRYITHHEAGYGDKIAKCDFLAAQSAVSSCSVARIQGIISNRSQVSNNVSMARVKVP